jgi:hypothetical protein
VVAVHYNSAVAVHYPDLGPEIGSNSLHLGIGRGDIEISSFVYLAVAGGQKAGFIVQSLGFLLNQLLVGQFRRHGGYGAESQKAEDQVA